MKIQELFDIDRFIKTNDIKEVTSQQIYKTRNEFNPNGLFSEQIFGQTSEEQKYRCGYISLPLYVFNPCIAKTIISRSGGIIRKLAYAECKCDLVDGVLKQSENGKYCGLKDLYSIWEKIDIEKSLGTKQQDILDILTKTPKRLLFNNKILVLPPGFRPIGMRNGRATKNELNTLYMHILGLKSVTAHATIGNVYQIDSKFQDAVMNIYTYVHDHVGSKNGYFQKNLLAKTTKWTVRNVISAPSYNSENPEIGLFRTGYPLHSCVSLFHPFVAFEMKQFFSLSNLQNIHIHPEEINPEDLKNIYDSRMINELMHIYMHNPGSRFRILYLDPENQKPIIMQYMDLEKNEPVQRPMTLTDVIYLCAKICIVDADRHVYTVRYPIGDYFGSFFTKVHILSTNRTTRIQFLGETFNSYPAIDPNLSHHIVSISFADTIKPANSRLKAIGGDYDGDTVKSVGLWSEEANKKAEELMYSKVYNVTPQGTTPFMVTGGFECLLGLYGLTKEPDEKG